MGDGARFSCAETYYIISLLDTKNKKGKTYDEYNKVKKRQMSIDIFYNNNVLKLLALQYIDKRDLLIKVIVII